MEEYRQGKNSERRRMLFQSNGKVYFSKETERKFFFTLTLGMLLLGILAKLGLF